MVDFIEKHIIVSLILLFSSTFLFTYYLIPRIIKLVNYKHLMDTPNHRSSHKELTPTFGGIAFYIILVFTLLLINDMDGSKISLNIIASLSILLFIGLKDDLVVISYKAKLLGQLFSVLVFLYTTGLYQINFHGFLGLYELGFWLGSMISILISLSIINALNLIDGIDGLASATGIIILSLFAIIFFTIQNYYFAIICVSFIGSLLAFLRFNLSSRKKIFMGDTGSLIIGFTVSVLTLKFLTLDKAIIQQINFIPHNSMFVILSILVFPMFDMFRIIMVRISKNKHPLLADKNHTHHVLLDLGNSHRKTSLIICVISFILSILLIYLTTIIDNSWVLALIFVVTFCVFMWIFFKLSLKRELEF